MLHITADELPRFMACNGSLRMAPSYPVEAGDTSARDEGIAAHYMSTVAHSGKMTVEELIDRQAPNGIYMTSEMAEHVTAYLKILPPGEMEVDTSFAGESWSVGARSDHIGCDAVTLVITDLKYGFRLVEPTENWSLIAHAIGYCVRNGVVPQRVTFNIFQPRPYHPDGIFRSHTITYDELWNRYGQLNAALSNPADELRTNPYCGKCHALATCPAARAANYNAIDTLSRVFADDMPDAALSFELDTMRAAEDIIKSRANALQELAMHRLKSGRVIENYVVEDRFGNRAWKQGLTVPLLSMATGIDVSKPGFVTPAEAERRGVPEHVVKALTDRPMIGKKLSRITADQMARRLMKKKS